MGPSFKTLRTAFFATAFATLPHVAFSQEACTTYTVKAGDTLATIAQAAYGSFDFQAIFNANRDALAANPNELPAGLQLILPCASGEEAGVAAGSVIASETEKQASKKKKDSLYEPPIKIVSANGWEPFTGQEETGGGMFNRILTTALQRGGNDRESTLEWVDDFSSHLDVLLPSGAFDVSSAWIMPDCRRVDEMDEGGVKLCTKFDRSLPIYEFATSFMALADNKYANVDNYAGLEGARICQPADTADESLELEGLVEPFVTMVRMASDKDCAQAIVNGEADVMSASVEAADPMFAELGVSDQISVNPSLVRFESVYFLVSKSNPRGRVYLAMINRGLTEMRKSGEWYDIVSTALAEHAGHSD